MSSNSIFDPAPFQAAAFPEHLEITDFEDAQPGRVLEWLRVQSEQLPPPLSSDRVSRLSEQAPSEPLYTDKNSLSALRSKSEQVASGRISQRNLPTLRSLFEGKTESELIEFLSKHQLSDEQKKESLVICASLGYAQFLERILAKNPKHLLDPTIRGEILVATLTGQCDSVSQDRILELLLPKENYKQEAGYEWWIHSSGVWHAFIKTAELGRAEQMRFLMSKINMHPVLFGEALHNALEYGQFEIVEILSNALKKDSSKVSRDYFADALEMAREMPDDRMFKMLSKIKSPSLENSRGNTSVKSVACIVC